jgi:hypothetical protein
MLTELGSFIEDTKDVVLTPVVPDGRTDWHGMPLYRFP